VTARWHLLPSADLREHIRTPSCWCHPEPDDEEPRVWLHNAMDGRELIETGKRRVQ
jgi:hypothetical protein